MYERPDVPKGGKHTNTIAIVVLVVIAIAIVVLVTTLWRLANENTALGDKDLSGVVAAATVSDDTVSSLGDDAGYVPSSDTLTTVLFVVTPKGSDSKLSALYLAVLNETQNTAKLVQLASDARLVGDDSGASLASVYADKGTSGLVSDITGTCGVPVSHVVVMTESGWNAFMSVAAQGSSALTSKATELLGGITKSDMDTSTLLDIAQRAVSAGLSGDAVVAVPTSEAADDSGNSYTQMLPSDIAILAGVLTEG